MYCIMLYFIMVQYNIYTNLQYNLIIYLPLRLISTHILYNCSIYSYTTNHTTTLIVFHTIFYNLFNVHNYLCNVFQKFKLGSITLNLF